MLNPPFVEIVLSGSEAATAAAAIFSAGSAPTIALWRRLIRVQEARDAEIREILNALHESTEAIRNMAHVVREVHRALVG